MLVLALDTSTPAVTAGVCRLDLGPAADSSVPDARDSSAGGDGAKGVASAVDQSGAPWEVTTLATRVTEDARAHAELLTPHILECLAEAGITAADLDAVVVGVGPGPFTGLRVGMATAAAFADAVGVPVHGVCSLDGLAARARRLLGGGVGRADSNAAEGVADGVVGDVVVVTDARRREAYHARYTPNGTRTDGPSVGPAAGINAAGATVVGDPAKLAEAAATVTAAAPAALAGITSPDPAGLVAVAAPDLLAGVQPAPLVPLYLRRPDAVPPRRVEPSSALRGVQR